MNEMVVTSREEANACCDAAFEAVRERYAQTIDELADSGVEVTWKLLFYRNAKFFQKPGKRSSVRLCVCLYPKGLSRGQAKEQAVCQEFYSIVGKYEEKDGTFRLRFQEKPDRAMGRFLQTYLCRLKTLDAEMALRERISDVFRSLFYINRYGSDYKKKYKNVRVDWILAGILIISLAALLVLRMYIPTGYHPSIRGN